MSDFTADPEIIAAIIDGREPLPLVVADLNALPAEKQDRYRRQLDGSYRLAWIDLSDGASWEAYPHQIHTGKLRVYQAGDTPERESERIAERTVRVAEERAKDDEIEAAERRVAELRAEHGRPA